MLNIGAETGAWACLLARYAHLVTAVEPSPTMIEIMEQNLAAEGIENVQIVRAAWTHDSLEEALADVKRRLELPESEPSEHDAFLRELLRRRLTQQDGRYAWPPGVRSALVYWDAKS